MPEIHPTAEEMRTGTINPKSLNCPMTFNTPDQQDILPCAKEYCAWWVDRSTITELSGCAIRIIAIKIGIK